MLNEQDLFARSLVETNYSIAPAKTYTEKKSMATYGQFS